MTAVRPPVGGHIWYVITGCSALCGQRIDHSVDLMVAVALSSDWAGLSELRREDPRQPDVLHNGLTGV